MTTARSFGTTRARVRKPSGEPVAPQTYAPQSHVLARVGVSYPKQLAPRKWWPPKVQNPIRLAFSIGGHEFSTCALRPRPFPSSAPMAAHKNADKMAPAPRPFLSSALDGRA